jgi:chitin disaccharide deacetylase
MAGFILCADDFALTAGVSRGILELLAAGKLSATGAMTNRPHWRAFAPELMAYSAAADIGVHLNLTCAAPLAPMPRLAPGGRLPLEINRQLDAFEKAAGRAPDFLDGHQHVHVLPGIRGQVIATLRRRYEPGQVYLRDPSDTPSAILRRGICVKKALAVKGLATGLADQAQAAGIPLNKGFSGFSAFDATRDFAADMKRYLAAAGPCHLVMCHPGHVDDELGLIDPVTASRQTELTALLHANLVGISRFGALRQA